MTKAKPTIKLFFKYPGYPWELFDQTRDEAWADVQYSRMRQEHPGVDYKREPEAKKSV